MALTYRQQRLYIHRIDIYAPKAIAVNGISSKSYKETDYLFELSASNVPCYVYTNRESSILEVVGRTNTDIMYTLDVLHVAMDVYIDTNFMFKLINVGTSNPDNNAWYIVQGGPATRASSSTRYPNNRVLFCKRGLKPPNVA